MSGDDRTFTSQGDDRTFTSHEVRETTAVSPSYSSIGAAIPAVMMAIYATLGIFLCFCMIGIPITIVCVVLKNRNNRANTTVTAIPVQCVNKSVTPTAIHVVSANNTTAMPHAAVHGPATIVNAATTTQPAVAAPVPIATATATPAMQTMDLPVATAQIVQL